MARPRLFDEPLTPAERQRRRRAKRRTDSLPTPLWTPAAAVTKPAQSVTKPDTTVRRAWIDVRALIG